MNPKRIRKDFPILERKVKGKQLVYLDNAATTQKPTQVISKITDFYMHHNSNIHRGIHTLSQEATEEYEAAHASASKFINADFEELVFTRNATESLNLLAGILKNNLKKGDEILISMMEHHSNIVPWQQIAKEKGAKIIVAPIKNGFIDAEEFSRIISRKTKIVSLIHMSNVLGTASDARKLISMARDNGSKIILDSAQSIPHMRMDVKKLKPDFMVFSGHKMLAPTGIGALYGRRDLLENLPPYMTGGDMIREVTMSKSTWNDLPWKYEAGTPNISGALGLKAAMEYIRKIGFEEIEDYEKKLSKAAFNELSGLDFIDLYSPKESRGVFSFNIKGVHPHDASSLLDDHGIAVRGGHHCAMPLMRHLGISGSLRASLYFYNTKEEIMLLSEALKKVRSVF